MPRSSARLAVASIHADAGLAADLRALRKSRRVTLAELALKLGRSVGWVSQVERGISRPSIDDLKAIAAALSAPLSLLFGHQAGDERERGVIVRSSHRRALGSAATGLTEELLSPDLGGSFEVLRSEFAPGAQLGRRSLRATEEAGYVVSGVFEIEIDSVWHRLNPGDSFRFKEKAHSWRNPGDAPAVVIWVVSPPVY